MDNKTNPITLKNADETISLSTFGKVLDWNIKKSYMINNATDHFDVEVIIELDKTTLTLKMKL